MNLSLPTLLCPTGGGGHLPRQVREGLAAWGYETFALPKYSEFERLQGGDGTFKKVWNLGKEHAFIKDHNVKGRVLMPATSYFVTAWEAASRAAGRGSYPPVEMTDVVIHNAVEAKEGESVTLAVNLLHNHRFQVRTRSMRDVDTS